MVDEWARKPIDELLDSFRQYRNSPESANLDNAFRALDASLERAMRAFLKHSQVVSQEEREQLFPPNRTKFLTFPELLNKSVKNIPDIPEETISEIRAGHSRRTHIRHGFQSISREEYENVASAAAMFFSRLFRTQITFEKCPPLAINMAPSLTQTLVGREDQIKLTKEALLSGSTNLLFIYGMAGVGKTSLASHIAHDEEIRRKYSDGILWLTLDRTSEPETLITILSEVFRIGTEITSSFQGKTNAVQLTLLTKRVLLILDNVSYKQSDHLKTLLKGKGRDNFYIVTTRDADLYTRFEPSKAIELGNLHPTASLHLMQRVARNLTTNEGVLLTIASRSGYNPLALTIAARLISSEMRAGSSLDDVFNTFSMEALLSERLDEAWPDLKAENATLANIIGISYQRLRSEEQQAFRQLAVFSIATAGFDDDALQAVWEKDTQSTIRIRRRLIDRGLLEILGEKRFRIHPMISAFADHLLSQDLNEVLGSFVRYIRFYLRRINDKHEVTVTDPDLRNSLAAFHILQNAPEEVINEPGYKDFVDLIGLGHSLALRRYFHSQGMWEHLNAWNRLALRASRSNGIIAIEVSTLVSEAERFSNLGEPAQAIHSAKEALRLAQEHSDLDAIVHSMSILALMYIRTYNVNNALLYAKQARELMSEQTPSEIQSRIFVVLGEAYRINGNPINAVQYYQQALRIEEEGTSPGTKAAILNAMGMAQGEMGKYHDAIPTLIQGYELAYHSGEFGIAAKNLTDLGYAYQQISRCEEAISPLEQAIEYYELTGEQLMLVIAKNNLGLVYRDLKRYSEAGQLFAQSLRLSNETDNRIGAADSQNNLGTIYLMTGDTDRAIGWLEKARNIYEEAGVKLKLPHNLMMLGECYVQKAQRKLRNGRSAQGTLRKAKLHMEKSLSVAQEVNDSKEQAIAYSGLAVVYLLLNDLNKAEEYIKQSEIQSIRVGLGVLPEVQQLKRYVKEYRPFRKSA